MPIPTSAPPDDFAAAARRHYDDAVLLREHGRADNAVYLAGYVQECCLKACLCEVRGFVTGRHYGHDVGRLGPAALAFLVASGSRVPARLAIAVRAGGVIDQGHPDRRYWPDTWEVDDAADALGAAREALIALVWAPALDGGGGLP